jgi:hypothetical protein
MFYLFIYFAIILIHAFIGWETTAAIANYSGPKMYRASDDVGELCA